MSAGFLILKHTIPETNIGMENPPFWWYLPGKMGFSWAMVVPERVPISMIDYDRISQKSSLGRDENSDSKVEISRRKNIWTLVAKTWHLQSSTIKTPSTTTINHHHHQPPPLLTKTLPPTLPQPPSTQLPGRTTPRGVTCDVGFRSCRNWMPNTSMNPGPCPKTWCLDVPWPIGVVFLRDGKTWGSLSPWSRVGEILESVGMFFEMVI